MLLSSAVNKKPDAASLETVMTINQFSSESLLLVDKFGRGESLIGSATMSTSYCLLVKWEQKISELVCSLISFVACIFGRLTEFVFFCIHASCILVLVVSWPYPSRNTTSKSQPGVLFIRCLTTYSANEANVSPLLRWLSSIPPSRSIKEGSIESKITPHLSQRSRALLAFALSLRSPSSVNKARGSAAS